MSPIQLIQFLSVHKAYGPKGVITDLNLTIHQGQRIVLVGENGSGKTTLAKLAMGLERPDSGSITVKSSCKIGYLPQDSKSTQSDLTLHSFLLEAQGELYTIEKRLRKLEDLISQTSDPVVLQQLTESWDQLHERYLKLNGYEASNRACEVLLALGLDEMPAIPAGI